MKTNVLVKGVCVLAVSCCLVECKKDDNGKTQEAKLTAITVDPASLNMFTGETKSITATPEPAGVEATFTWTSAQTSIATVNNGEVTGVAEGTTTITVSSGDVTATVTVNVSDIYMTDIAVDTEPLRLFIYDELQLDASPIPPNAVKETDIFYRTSDPDVVTVDGEGKVLALGAGTATLRVYHLAIAKEIEVTVTDFENIDDWGVSVSSFAGGYDLDEHGLAGGGSWTWEPGNVLFPLDHWAANGVGWHTANPVSMPQWLEVDMKDSKKLTGFYYWNATFGDAWPKAFTIDVRSSESDEWTTVLESEDFPHVNTLQTLIFADQEGFEETFGATFVWARYYRINITENHGNYDFTYVARLKPIEPEAPPTE